MTQHDAVQRATSDDAWKGDIARIDHTVIKVKNLEAAVAWYRRLLGLVETARDKGRVYLASPVTGQLAVGLVEGGGAGIDYVSYAVRGPDALERIAARLDAKRVPYARGIKDSRPGAIDALRLTVPTGHTFEFLLADHVENELRPEYVPGAMDVRTSHVQVRTQDVIAMSDFMRTVGFKVSTFAPLPNGTHLLQFMRVNDRHHQLAILTGAPGVHHVALELDTADFWKFCDHLGTIRSPAEYGPGRHLEGDLLFIYVRDPDGNRLEICGPMAACGYDYEPNKCSDEPWYHMNRWGPQPPHSWHTEWN